MIHFEYVVDQNYVRGATSQRLPEESTLSPSTPKPRRISGSAIGAEALMNTEGWCNTIRLRIAQLRAQLNLKGSWFSVVKVSSGPQTSDPKTSPAFYLTPSPMTDLGAIEGGTMRSAFLHCKAAVLATCVVGYFLSKPGGRSVPIILVRFRLRFRRASDRTDSSRFKKICRFSAGTCSSGSRC